MKTIIRPDVVGSGLKGSSSSNESKASPIEIKIAVNSSNPETEENIINNHVDLTIPVIVEADIILRGLVNYLMIYLLLKVLDMNQKSKLIF